jgi:hypothetical protein
MGFGLDTFIARDYTSQITITARLVFSVKLLGSGFQRRSVLGFCVQRLLFLTVWHLPAAAPELN